MREKYKTEWKNQNECGLLLHRSYPKLSKFFIILPNDSWFHLTWFIHKLCRHQYLFSLISGRYADSTSNRTFNWSQMRFFLLYVGLIYPSGGPISPHLLRYRAFAVKNHSCLPCASHLRQTRSVSNPGYINEKKSKKVLYFKKRIKTWQNKWD